MSGSRGDRICVDSSLLFWCLSNADNTSSTSVTDRRQVDLQHYIQMVNDVIFILIFETCKVDL